MIKFGVIGDPHIRRDRPARLKTLRWRVEQYNTLDVSFVLVTGDLAHMGRIDELEAVKEALDGLKAPYFTCHGNHCGDNYRDIFGAGVYLKEVDEIKIFVLSIKEPMPTPQKADIALIHFAANTSRHELILPFTIDNPKLQTFLAECDIRRVYQGHLHYGEPQRTMIDGILYVCSGASFSQKTKLMVETIEVKPVA